MVDNKAFSAPGKALIAGGYLVLFPEYHSLVVALSSRMHATITSTHSNYSYHTIKIESPQFKGEWEYQFEKELREINEKYNPFIESTLNVIFNFLSSTDNLKKDIKISIFSDPEYHSQENTVKRGNFLFHDLEITQVPKTGLGSSAGLVTVLTTSLLSQFKDDFDLSLDKNLIHNLSQISHCIAQKKIGSGFDVASATFGSIVYRRFKPEVINELVSGDFTNLTGIANAEWEFQHDRCSLPPGIKLLMGDVSGGSNTPKLVSKVLNWRNLHPSDAQELFNELNLANTKLIDSINVLTDIHDNNPSKYKELLSSLSTHTSVEIASYSAFSSNALKNKPLLDIIDSIKTIRALLRKLTRSTGAEIEPFEQTKLLNNCNANFKGCLGGVVPGAGGYDAICLLCHEDSVAKIMSTPLDKVRWLDLCEDTNGVVEEAFDKYQGI